MHRFIHAFIEKPDQVHGRLTRFRKLRQRPPRSRRRQLGDAMASGRDGNRPGTDGRPTAHVVGSVTAWSLLSADRFEQSLAVGALIVAYDLRFFERLPEIFPHNPDAATKFADNPALAGETAFRNGTLQGAYLILALRTLGLDVGSMSGFDRARVDVEFFPDGRVRSNWLMNIGTGDPSKLFPRSPRLEFDDAVQVL